MFPLIAIFVVSLFIPGELHAVIGGVRIEPYRIVLIVAFLMNGGQIMRLLLSNKLLLGYIGLYAIAFFIHVGPRGFQTNVILFLEIGVCFALGAFAASDPNIERKTFQLFGTIFLVLAPFAVKESMDGYRILHVWAGNLIGNGALSHLGYDYYRFGIHRTSVSFSHPILYSITAAMLLPFFVFRSDIRYRKAIILSLLLAVLVSVSSVGVLMIAAYTGFYALNVIYRNYNSSIYRLVVAGAIFIFIIASVFSNRGPVLLAIQTFAFDKHTSYTRYLQWIHTSDDISANPLFGIGFQEWTRPEWIPPSIDSFWLLTALESGLPSIALLGLFFYKMAKSAWSEWNASGDNYFYVCFVSIFAIIFAGFTVDFFDRAPMMVLFIVGIIYARINLSQRARAELAQAEKIKTLPEYKGVPA